MTFLHAFFWAIRSQSGNHCGAVVICLPNWHVWFYDLLPMCASWYFCVHSFLFMQIMPYPEQQQLMEGIPSHMFLHADSRGPITGFMSPNLWVSIGSNDFPQAESIIILPADQENIIISGKQ